MKKYILLYLSLILSLYASKFECEVKLTKKGLFGWKYDSTIEQTVKANNRREALQKVTRGKFGDEISGYIMGINIRNSYICNGKENFSPDGSACQYKFASAKCQEIYVATKEEKIFLSNRKVGDLPLSKYIINSNATVIDKNTGLMWRRCVLGQQWTGKTCKKILVKGLSKLKYSLYQVNKLQDKGWEKFAGYSDWRLPTKEEISSLFWCSNGVSNNLKNTCGGENHWTNEDTYIRPTIDYITFPNTPPKKRNFLYSSYAWTSNSLEKSNSSHTYFGDFEHGFMHYIPKDTDAYIRLVREK